MSHRNLNTIYFCPFRMCPLNFKHHNKIINSQSWQSVVRWSEWFKISVLLFHSRISATVLRGCWEFADLVSAVLVTCLRFRECSNIRTCEGYTKKEKRGMRKSKGIC